MIADMARWLRYVSILCLLLAAGSSVAALTDIQVNNNQHQVKVMLKFDQRPAYAVSTLHTPERVLVDISGFQQKITDLPLNFSGQNLLQKMRQGQAKKPQDLRLVFDLKLPVTTKSMVQQQGSGYLLTLTLSAVTAPQKNTQNTQPKKIATQDRAVSPVDKKKTTSNDSQHKSKHHSDSQPQSAKQAQPEAKGIQSAKLAVTTKAIRSPGSHSSEFRSPDASSFPRHAVIAIDAGHGGQDPGAIGPTGLREKDITLLISRKLAERLRQDPLFTPVMTRTGDYFVSVMGRSDVARQKQANLLVSIHADAAPNRNATGASVWVLSNKRANSEMGRWLEQHEKQSELLGGAGNLLANKVNDPYLSQTVLDLQFGHSQRVGYDVALSVLRRFGRINVLHKQSPQHASLGVLRSPDIPSLLVETGFISNYQEERKLDDEKHQIQIADAIYHGIRDYFIANPLQAAPMSSPSKLHRQHLVKRGENLLVIAKRYNVAVAELRKINQLSSDKVATGQQLIIPQS